MNLPRMAMAFITTRTLSRNSDFMPMATRKATIADRTPNLKIIGINAICRRRILPKVRPSGRNITLEIGKGYKKVFSII